MERPDDCRIPPGSGRVPPPGRAGVLHSLSLDHTGGIMCVARKNSRADPMGFKLTSAQMVQLRQPTWMQLDTEPVCGQGGAEEPECCRPSNQ